MKPDRNHFLLYAVVFVVGSASLGSEIAAARLLAPSFGASTIIWANTIATVLLALSVGYWLGGRFADRNPTLAGLAHIVVIAAALLAAVPFVATPLLSAAVDALDAFAAGAFLGSLFSVLMLMALPLVLLGAVAPYAVRLAVENISEAGRTVGRLYAISTLGSLTGVFMAALVLIPFVGTRRTFLVFSLVLALIGVICIRRWFWLAPVLGVGVLLCLPVGTVKSAARGERLLEERETEYQYARVIETADGERRLELNEGQAVHSLYRPYTVLTDNYWDDFLVLPGVVLGKPPAKIAILGNAAGTIARAYGVFFPKTQIDAVEIDPQLSELGRKWFGMRAPRLHVYHADARPFLRRTKTQYEAIFVDTYRQPYVPFYLATQEFFALAHQRLAPGGVLIINVGHPEGETALEKALIATLQRVFLKVYRDDVALTNTLLIATNSPVAQQGKAVVYPQALLPLARGVKNRFLPAGRGKNVFRDDRAPVEWLTDKSIIEIAAGGK